MNKVKKPPRFLRLRLSVKDIRPEIWRTLVVSPDVTLARLHTILQILMGWKDNHLYAYAINQKRYAPPDVDAERVGKSGTAGTKLSSIFGKETDVLRYEYDFGDCWEIELRTASPDGVFEQTQSVECMEGLRHGPVEDSGGPRRYMEMVDIYRNPQHRRHLEIQKWMGKGFDAEAFDLVKTNEMLKAIG
jgi:hypothetical protein